MKKLVLGLVASAALLPAAADAAIVSVDSYASAANSPFSSVNFSGGYFHLENFEDHALNTPGVTQTVASGAVSTVRWGVSVGNDSVDGDDSTPGSCNSCDSYWGADILNFVFDENVLGALPTYAGLVWTDGAAGSVTFNAFDALGNLLGSLTKTLGGTAFNDQDVLEDTFFGAIFGQGIKTIQFVVTGGIEVDHLQYGRPDANAIVTPIPAAAPLLLSGLAGLMALRRRKAAK